MYCEVVAVEAVGTGLAGGDFAGCFDALAQPAPSPHEGVEPDVCAVPGEGRVEGEAVGPPFFVDVRCHVDVP